MTVNLALPNGNTFAVGGDVSLQCDIGGYPTPVVTWFKDDVEIQESDRIHISGKLLIFLNSLPSFVSHINDNIFSFPISGYSQLNIREATAADSGWYKCTARNSYSDAFHAEHINIEGEHLQKKYSILGVPLFSASKNQLLKSINYLCHHRCLCSSRLY